MAKDGATANRPGVHIKWAADVADHDYAAAEAYLSLKLGEDAVAKDVLCQPPVGSGWRLAVKRFALGPCGPPVG